MPIKHNKVSTIPDTTDNSVIQPSDWNDNHFIDDFVDFPMLNANPSVPAPGSLRVFGRSRGGRAILSQAGPSGIITALQPALFGNAIAMWLPGTGTTASISFGVNWTVIATQAHPGLAASSFLAQMRRATFTTTTTAGNAAGVRSAAVLAYRGNMPMRGGFFFFARFAMSTYVAGSQLLVGMSNLNATLNGEPSAQNHTVAIGFDSTDTTYQLIFRDATNVTKVDTGVAINTTDAYDIIFFCPPNDNQITVRFTRLNDNAILVDNVSYNSSLPGNTTFLNAHTQVRTTVEGTAAQVSLMRIYVETDT